MKIITIPAALQAVSLLTIPAALQAVSLLTIPAALQAVSLLTFHTGSGCLKFSTTLDNVWLNKVKCTKTLISFQ